MKFEKQKDYLDCLLEMICLPGEDRFIYIGIVKEFEEPTDMKNVFMKY